MSYREIRRLWPITILYSLIWVFIMPVMLWNSARFAGIYNYAENNPPITMAENLAGEVVQLGVPAAVLVSFFAGLIAAAAVFSYLMRANSAELMHGFPATRGLQFLAHTAAGYALLTAGNAWYCSVPWQNTPTPSEQ